MCQRSLEEKGRNVEGERMNRCRGVPDKLYMCARIVGIVGNGGIMKSLCEYGINLGDRFPFSDHALGDGGQGSNAG